MQPAKTWLLDTGILLHWIRASKAAEAIDAQFHLRESSFRPLICVVSLGEIEAFARNRNWGQGKRDTLKNLKKELVTVDISDARVIDAYADISSLARTKGWSIFQGKNDLWIAAAARVTSATLITTNNRDFRPLRDDAQLDAVLVDPHTGQQLT
ncbi:MAG: type II toxin-antitoxin system VapC family toxin [Sulfuritalea sp.]|nr:type II toxin-antitoxin system VapC family toxin [Sulfuritalea sp.]